MVSDYSDWLTTERLDDLELEWAKMDRTPLFEMIESYMPTKATVIEFCCGTGWIPMGLQDIWSYTGLDANEECIDRAVEKNPGLTFIHGDIRKFFHPINNWDLALAFSCLKHFSLEEIPGILCTILRCGDIAIFSAFMGRMDREDESQGWPHTQICRGTLDRIVSEAGHKIVHERVLEYPLGGKAEPIFVTERLEVTE